MRRCWTTRRVAAALQTAIEMQKDQLFLSSRLIIMMELHENRRYFWSHF